MKGRYFSILLIFILIVMGKFTFSRLTLKTHSLPLLNIAGDIEEIYYLDLDILTESITINNETHQAVKLGTIIHKAKPLTDNYEVLIKGEDGIVSLDQNIDDCFIIPSEKKWVLAGSEVITAQGIGEIVVVSKESLWSYGFNIIEMDKNILNITPGQLYKLMAERGHKKDEGFSLEGLIGNELDRLLIMGREGGYGFDDGKGHLEFRGNSIDYICKDNRRIVNAVGALINPPGESILDTYVDAAESLQKDERVMILVLDGFGYHQYLDALENGYAPYLSSFNRAKAATTVYKPVTNAGLAAMITGRPPSENGVFSRKQRDYQVPSIFQWAHDLNKRSALIEGDIKVLNTEIQPILSTDRNGNGSTDDEIFETGLNILLKEENDLVLIHFHGIDDSGHSHGDMAPETKATITKTDGYIEKLLSNWTGKVIITSDHGMHSNANGEGYHGDFIYEDMIVPYLVIVREE